jgi:hypothetical protein
MGADEGGARPPGASVTRAALWRRSSPTPRKSGHLLLRRVKARLQFSGWLQYLIVAVAGLMLLLLAGAGRLIGSGRRRSGCWR